MDSGVTKAEVEALLSREGKLLHKGIVLHRHHGICKALFIN